MTTENNMDLLEELGYEPDLELTGGEVEAPETQFKPRGPEEAKQNYGDFALPKCYTGQVVLPRQTNYSGVISCHRDIQYEMQELVTALYGAADGLIKTIAGFEQRMRQNMPSRYGNSRIAPSSWGLSVAINRSHNPESRQMLRAPIGPPIEDTERGLPGYVLYLGHPLVVVAESEGWAWLGKNIFPDGSVNAFPDPASFAWVRRWS